MTVAPESETWSLLPGSERPAALEAQVAPDGLPADELVEVTIVLRRPTEPNTDLRVISTVELADRFAASKADVAAVQAALEPLGLTVRAVHRPSRRMRVGGTVGAMEHTFGTTLRWVVSTAPDGSRHQHRQRTEALHGRAALDGIVTAVLGLDDRPQARTQTRVASAATGISYLTGRRRPPAGDDQAPRRHRALR